ncbi:MAG: UDP-glucose 4-epimerase GalE [Clostridiaceae bacterium]|nr:UDP-glucose 4-epimerase GalE [Clostridiaceae bacterium]
MAVLVAGGAGYIGSHTVAELIEKGEDVVVVDSLVKGHREAVGGCKFYHGDLRDTGFLDRVFDENRIDSVIDFAASSLVGESMSEPLEYYKNNLISVMNLLDKMKEYKVPYIVFSSTAAVYGEPENIPILETDRTEPTNPYGETKLAIEKMLKWCEKAYGIRYATLRYFNAAGARIDGSIGEDHDPESHLIPIILQAALGKRKAVQIYGDDYPTPDGTCIRDYIHVTDLADAHILALNGLREGSGSGVYNLGNGKGFSVKEVIDTAKKVTGHAIPVEITQRRKGDPAVLVASSEKAKRELGWEPRYNDLETIIESAWRWHSTHPDGFAG